MSLLASLVHAYERMPEQPPLGFSNEKISLLISLYPDGEIATISDIRLRTAKGVPYPISMLVPQPIKRTAAISPNFLWDKTSYVLGVTAEADARVLQKHAAFVQMHERLLANANDDGLSALLLFLRNWSPDHFKAPRWKDEYKDLNVVFGLERERSEKVFLHTRPVAQTIISRIGSDDDRPSCVCSITGKVGTIARLHPSIKGVRGAHVSGAALVSFNLDASTSYGHQQGDNAQISERAAFAYTTALNRFLSRGSGHVVSIGDTSVVFWAEAEDTQDAALAESHFENMINMPGRGIETPLRNSSIDMLPQLRSVARGKIVRDMDIVLPTDIRFHIVALTPNNARIAVRF